MNEKEKGSVTEQVAQCEKADYHLVSNGRALLIGHQGLGTRFTMLYYTSGLLLAVLVACTGGSKAPLRVEECFPGYYMCATGTCIPESFVCNGVVNCVTGDDEMNCGQTGNSTSEVFAKCSEFSYECAGGVCVPLDKVCDGIINCIMGDDEEHCEE
ncbi:putative sortilin-related receptor [Penaeus vannamei]|uniref:Putative sortilin-related receptor n=1 Tax=Penaeus vannamei TaxID=6689 RepID=A0A423TZ05_PENVA|nr:putative sortilin-related receptor [Penaeus vannamei]